MTPADIRNFFAAQRAAKHPEWEPVKRMTSDLSKYAQDEENAQRKRDAKEDFEP